MVWEGSMRRTLVIVIAAGVLSVAAFGTAGCAKGGVAGGSSATDASARDGDAGGLEAAIYVPVLRRYLASTDNSFSGQVFETVYVLDQAFPDAASPVGNHDRGTPIGPSTRRQITVALAGTAHVAFIEDGQAVIETRDGCAQVKDSSILITLGTLNGDQRRAKVAIGGFVACLGATWLTYVVQNQPGTGWQVAGTTGPMAIS
jgi:hypothetical protein